MTTTNPHISLRGNDGHHDVVQVGNSLDEARQYGQNIVSETFQHLAPVQVFQQGGRTMVSTVLPIKVLKRAVKLQSATKGDTAEKAIDVTNRPVVPEHRKSIVAYLVNAVKRGETYILPPITLNSDAVAQIFVPQGSSRINSGYMVVPEENSIQITDGQHRYLAICDATEQLSASEASKFENDCVPVMMTLSNELSQVHQDFADAGKTKALPPSLLAVWDTRQPANDAVLKISQDVTLLKGRVDATSTSIGKSSPFVFLANQVRQFVKGSLTGNSGTSDRQFAQQAEDALGNRDSRERWIKSRVAFLNVMAEIVPDWKEIAQLNRPNQADAASVVQSTKEIRERQNVPMNGAFLATLGLLSHKVLKDATSHDKGEAEWMEELRHKLQPFHNIQWDRSAKIWNGNIIVSDDQGNHRIRTQGPAVKGAAEAMLKLLGIDE